MPATTPRPPSSEQVTAFDRTAWSRSIGIHGRNPRNPQLEREAPPVHEAKPSRAKKVLASSANLISEFVETGFFAAPKELNAIRLALKEQGHFYPTTTLSPTLLRLVRKRQLRRIKENKRWVYVT